MHIKRVIHAAFAAAPMFALGACATIIEGSDQPINVSTTPQGAMCTLTREGQVLATVGPTPAQIIVEKSKNDITINCKKDGHSDGEAINAAEFGGTTAGNIIAGGLIGLAVDAASGANYSYQENVEITLQPIPPALPTAPEPAKKPAPKPTS